jgi:hypothetical protein
MGATIRISTRFIVLSASRRHTSMTDIIFEKGKGKEEKRKEEKEKEKGEGKEWEQGDSLIKVFRIVLQVLNTSEFVI